MVFPTPVGVFPHPKHPKSRKYSLPHACGGVSMIIYDDHDGVLSSPRLWGCFQIKRSGTPGLFVFPTPVGVFRKLLLLYRMSTGLPHACGGVS